MLANNTNKARSPGVPGGDGSRTGVRWGFLEIFGAHPVPNLAIVLAFVIGFFHGWLKLVFRSPVTTFAFDIPLIFAVLVVLFQLPSISHFFPDTRVSRAIFRFFGAVAVWTLLSLVLPGGAPLAVAVASARTWMFAMLAYGLGFHVIRSSSQVIWYLRLMILLAAATALYATGQTEEEVLALRAIDPYFAMRTMGSGYMSDDGRWVLRRFSTFISSGAFGGTMAVTLAFVLSMLTDKAVHLVERSWLALCGAMICYGMFLSGARSALVAFLLCAAVLVWYRRKGVTILAVLAIFVIGAYLGAKETGGGTSDRMSDLTGQGLWGRVYIVLVPGWSRLVESAFIGGGVGRSFGGVPMFLLHLSKTYDVWGVDGDLGRIMIEMGLVGLVLILLLIWEALREGMNIARRWRDTPLGSVAVGALGIMVVAAATFPVGSPFVGIPTGVLTWFWLGAVTKVHRLREALEASAPSPTETAADPAGPVAPAGSGRTDPPAGAEPKEPAAPTRHFMWETKRSVGSSKAPGGPGQPAAATPPPAPSPAVESKDSGRGNSKRFLYR